MRVMLRTASWIWTGLILAGLLSATPPASAQGKKDPPRTVQDEAGLFSKEAILAADKEIAVMKNQYHKDVMVETVESVKASRAMTHGKSGRKTARPTIASKASTWRSSRTPSTYRLKLAS